MEEKQKKDGKETKVKAETPKVKKVVKKEAQVEAKSNFVKVEPEAKRPEVKVEKKSEKKKTTLSSVIKTIFIFALIVVAIFIICTFLQWNLVCKIYDANTQIELGNNYKLTTEYSGENATTTVKLYKDGVGVYQLGNAGIIWTDNTKTYIILTELKQYFMIENGVPVTDANSTATLPTYDIFANKDKTALLQEVLLGKIQIKTEEFEGQACYLISTDTEKVWVNKETMKIIRDEKGTEAIETKVEQNVVTDKDIALPDLTKYTKLQ